MPTGYTAPIFDKDNYSFEEFVWRCARAMGALYHMRDSGLDAPISLYVSCKEDEAYHAEKVAEAQRELQRLRSLTPEQIEKEFECKAAETLAVLEKLREKARKNNAKLDAMLRQVRAWHPPSREHRGLKDLMIEQLVMSQESENFQSPRVLSPKEGYEQAVQHQEREFKYHMEQLSAVRTRAQEKQQWLRDLNASVPLPKHLRDFP